jgi:S-DNA-T family DNA segregation ATPase FtsK/SpoIIIE
VTSAAAHYAPSRPRLDAISPLALSSTLAAPPAETQQADTGNADTGQFEDTTGDAEAVLRDALSAAPDEGISVPELVAVTGMRRRWVYYRLRELAASGRAAQTTRGRWRARQGRRP